MKFKTLHLQLRRVADRHGHRLPVANQGENSNDSRDAKFELTAVVSNIPTSASSDDVYNFFSEKCGQGSVKDVKFVPSNHHIACVEFLTQQVNLLS